MSFKLYPHMPSCGTPNHTDNGPYHRLANLALPPPGIKFKQSAMPFIQMENISHFLRACQSPPLNLPDHDMFLTVDLYEQKDPAQVLQCLGAFSRAASRVNPSAFPSAIGARSGGTRGGVLSPQSTGSARMTSPTTTGGRGDHLRGRGISNASNSSAVPTLTASRTGDSGSGRWSPTKSPPPRAGNNGSPVGVSSWSRKEHEGATSPAWNIAQYGYMGGASQGALGIAFGGRRQITSAGPHVPSLAEKEKKRREAEAEAERQRVQMEEEEKRRRAELEAEEVRAEERRWEEETRREREAEAKRIEEEKRKWEEEERQWKMEEERRKREEEEAERRLREERTRSRGNSDVRLRGQFLSQYQAEQGLSSPGSSQRSTGNSEYGSRVKELEKELELARQREAEYERERQGRTRRKPGSPDDRKAKARSRSRPASRPPSRQDSWRPKDDRSISVSPISSPNIAQGTQANQWSQPSQQDFDHGAESLAPPMPPRSPRPLPDPKTAAPPPSAPLKKQRTGEQQPPLPVRKHHTGSRPLPDPTAYAVSPPPAANAARSPPASIPPAMRSPPPATRTPQNKSPFARPSPYNASPSAQKPSPGPKKQSLLEREMELERQRQREWEEAQKETASRPRGEVDGVGGRWDVSQWSGYTGGDGQNKGAQGIGAGRRQIVGPRPLPGPPR